MRLDRELHFNPSEQAAAFAAGAEAHLAGKLAVCAGNFRAPTNTSEQVKDFGLFMMKAVLSRRGDEIIDFARVNLLR